MEFNYDLCSDSELNGINKFKRSQENVLLKNIEQDLDIMVYAAKSEDKLLFEDMNRQIKFIFSIMVYLDIYSSKDKMLLNKLLNRVISALNNNYFIEYFE